ncbi:hypothetical protein [Leucobacter sp. cx-169]|uniref:hypothetical protein n=1 Tax=Leucobacter sp. cx-169 TaxID=2770549 RepID=UPI00165E412C|nr:hypothetical protein [Leucobacter sp. cx-169]MBC9927204.1 hypothetical protein [Leucobacter sp. cx-169]
MSTKGRFDPEEGVPYGRCLSCEGEVLFASKEAASEHMSATFEEAQKAGGRSGHRISVLNQTREMRIQSEIDDIVDKAMIDVMDDALRLIGDATEEEITKAFRHATADFSDAWYEALEENR